jgi:DNA-binding NarL/FixJ family response regulator
MQRQQLRVGVADPDDAFREGVTWALRRSGARVVAEASTLAGLISATRDVEVDVILIEERLCAEPGANLPAPFAVVSGHPTLAGLQSAVTRGATGYVPRAVGGDALVRALEDVAIGVLTVPRGLLSALIHGTVGTPEPGSGPPRPTRRQGQVAALTEDGLSTAEIARALGVSRGTVRRHRSELAARLGRPSTGLYAPADVTRPRRAARTA